MSLVCFLARVRFTNCTPLISPPSTFSSSCGAIDKAQNITNLTKLSTAYTVLPTYREKSEIVHFFRHCMPVGFISEIARFLLAIRHMSVTQDYLILHLNPIHHFLVSGSCDILFKQ